MKKTLATVLLCAAIAFAGAGVSWFGIRMRQSDASVPAADADAAAEAVRVGYLAVAPRPVTDVIRLTGAFEPWEEVTLSAETRGVIEWQRTEEGEVVEAGQELIQVNKKPIEANVAAARADYQLAQQELERVSKLRSGGLARRRIWTARGRILRPRRPRCSWRRFSLSRA